MGKKFFGRINKNNIYYEECNCDERCKNYPDYSPDGSYSYYCSICNKGYFIKYKEEDEDLNKIKMLDFKIYLNNIRVEIEDLMRKNFDELGFKYTEELKKINNDIESIKNNLTSARNKIIDLL